MRDLAIGLGALALFGLACYIVLWPFDWLWQRGEEWWGSIVMENGVKWLIVSLAVGQLLAAGVLIWLL